MSRKQQAPPTISWYQKPLAAVRGFSLGITFGIKVFRPTLEANEKTICRIFGPDREAKPVAIRSSYDRNMVLSGAFWPGTRKECIVACHGLDHDATSMEPLLSVAAAAGFSVLVYDQRNAGGSGKTWKLWHLSRRYSSDLADAVQTARTLTEPGTSIAVVAYSGSTWPTIGAIWNGQVKVDGLICDSGPTPDMTTAMEARLRLFNRLRIRSGKPPANDRLIISMAGWLVKRMFGKQVWPPTGEGVPTILMVGERDRTIPPKLVQPLLSDIPGAKLVVVPRAGHVGSVKADPELYVSCIEQVLHPERTPIS